MVAGAVRGLAAALARLEAPTDAIVEIRMVPVRSMVAKVWDGGDLVAVISREDGGETVTSRALGESA